LVFWVAMSNTVSVTHISEVDAESLEAAACKFGSVWLARFVPVLRGAVVIMASHEEATACAAGLHGTHVGESLVAATLGRRRVTREQVAEYGLAPPKRVVQLVSPPPSPPEWWSGWNEEEAPIRPPPELLVDPAELLPAEGSESRTRELNVLAVDLYQAVRAKLPPADDAGGGLGRAPSLTIEAPPESLTNIPEGFTLVERKRSP
jgi:hypothetical protein